MTEAEAKTKWCPFARALVTTKDSAGNIVSTTSANQFPEDRASTCIGPACMAWRYYGTQYHNGPNTTDGFCGLAGSP